MSSLSLIKRGPLILKGTKPIAPRKQKTTVPKLPDRIEIQGEGRIVSFGNTVQGMETRFKEQIEIGDDILIRHPQTLAVEGRIVTEIHSNRSLGIHIPFSTDLVSTTEFSVRKAPVPQKSPREQQHVKEEKDTHGTIEGQESIEQKLHERIALEKSTLTYKDKSGAWNHATVSHQLDQHYSQEELLDMRCKKVHDKYC